MFLENLQKRQAIHARHLNVQRQDIRLQLQNHIARHVRIAGRAHNFNFRILRQSVGNHAAHDCGIVHHQHADFLLETHARFIN